MVDRDVFAARIQKLEQTLADLRRLASNSRETYLASHELETLAERWLHLAADCCLDLANHAIADRDWGQPNTYREAFTALAEKGVLPRQLSERMEGWAGLRNILVHLYLEVDHERLYEVLQEELDDLESYARSMTALLDE